jgi:hypothetical protein
MGLPVCVEAGSFPAKAEAEAKVSSYLTFEGCRLGVPPAFSGHRIVL